MLKFYYSYLSALTGFLLAAFHHFGWMSSLSKDDIPGLFISQTLYPGFRHSYRSASTGFLVAAFQLCQLTVASAIPIASNPASAKIHQLKGVL